MAGANGGAKNEPENFDDSIAPDTATVCNVNYPPQILLKTLLITGSGVRQPCS
jgi:hypothetical protein